MPSITTLFATSAALAALVSAVPFSDPRHGHGHRHARALSQRNWGQCGGASGVSCGPGYCCSPWGYCGTSFAYCGNGCQPEWGTCDNSSATSASGNAKDVAAQAVQTTTLSVVSSETTTVATVTETANQAPQSPSAWTGPTLRPSTLPSAATTYVPTATYAPSSSPPSSSAYSAPAASSTSSSSGGSSSGLGNTYKMYTGDGTTAAGWPAQSSWIDWESMWANNMAIISISCTQFGQANNSPQESADIKSAIESVAGGIGMDPRFVLAITMQESKGCVRAPTTNYGVVNPGLMQSHDGTGSCNNGAVQDPCPSSEITQMIKDGTTGTASGDGLEQTMSQSGATDVSKYYKAARIYNSGSIASSGDLGAGIATHCYSSDIANRLTGWVTAASTCTLD